MNSNIIIKNNDYEQSSTHTHIIYDYQSSDSYIQTDKSLIPIQDNEELQDKNRLEDKIFDRLNQIEIIEKFVSRYQSKINSSIIDKAKNILFFLKHISFSRAGIEYTSRNSLFFTILKGQFEIHLEYLFDLNENEQSYYSVYKDDDCIEVGNDCLQGAIVRIYSLIYGK